MAEFNLIQVGFFKPILNDLKISGVNVEDLLHSSELHKFQLHKEDLYVPVKNIYRLFDQISRKQGIVSFFESFFESIKLVSLSQWGQIIANTPDVLTGCNLASSTDQIVITHERIGFEINGTKAKLWQYLDDKPVKGWSSAIEISFILMLNGFSIAGGPNWAPLEIHLQGNSSPNWDVFLPVGNTTKVYTGQPVSAVVFPTSMLSMPMMGHNEHSIVPSNFGNTLSLAGKVQHLLDAFAYGSIPSIDKMAEIAGVSVRSFQRKLAHEGTTFFELVDTWRFKSALKKLAIPNNLTIREISQILGYANPSNFERAFRRWTNTTPIEYRHELSQS